MNDPSVALQNAGTAAVAVIIKAVDGRNKNTPSVCDGWSVHDLVNHIVGNMMMLNPAAESGNAHTGNHKDFLGDDPVAAAESALSGAVEALSGDGVTKTLQGPMGPIPASQLANIVAADVAVHTWDLAKSIGEDTTMSADVFTHASSVMVGDFVEGGRKGGAFGQAVAVDENADDQSKFIAFLGRKPN